jgi:hypothetical protein
VRAVRAEGHNGGMSARLRGVFRNDPTPAQSAFARGLAALEVAR